MAFISVDGKSAFLSVGDLSSFRRRRERLIYFVLVGFGSTVQNVFIIYNCCMTLFPCDLYWFYSFHLLTEKRMANFNCGLSCPVFRIKIHNRISKLCCGSSRRTVKWIPSG